MTEDDAPSLYEKAYQALDAALAAKGPDRIVLFDQALKLWRLARYASGTLTQPSPPQEDEPGDT